jgi:hypothetical protein
MKTVKMHTTTSNLETEQKEGLQEMKYYDAQQAFRTHPNVASERSHASGDAA